MMQNNSVAGAAFDPTHYIRMSALVIHMPMSYARLVDVNNQSCYYSYWNSIMLARLLNWQCCWPIRWLPRTVCCSTINHSFRIHTNFVDRTHKNFDENFHGLI